MIETLEAPAAESEIRFAVGERLNLAPSGKRFHCDFIEPGVVSYRDQPGGGVELLRKETIEEALNSALDNPLTIGHISTKITSFDGLENGKIDGIGYDARTGWFYCDGSVDTEQARMRIARGERPSCGYSVLEFGSGGVYHNIPYDREIAKIKFHHLAIVDNPRYEGANIRLNSKSPTMTLFKWIQKITRTEKVAGAADKVITEEKLNELAPDALVDIGEGKTATVKELVDAAIGARSNAMHAIGQDDEVEYDGAKYKMNDLVAAYRKNETDKKEKAEKDAKENEAKTSKEKEEEEKKNAIARANAGETPEDKAAREKQEKEIAAERERQNAQASSFKILSSARTNPVTVAPTRAVTSNSRAEGLARGLKNWG